ncbi:hypothetical protein CXG81DRAFT_19748 [Caulochytrium protostelioides]|uniref:Uncharacterized protein n=1 Tax=Caulochytrium protostelioides TaxID=1555241 RepID=A0A4P9X598_9FUNG|nr:hypothetical protein CXG81DRAFT_19748 [Caulochytrium protostelioides]|eukprot:RKP00284.1 hypothetical protein CXG81DRAFT_19748 [Caulochytrium protostelioides]
MGRGGRGVALQKPTDMASASRARRARWIGARRHDPFRRRGAAAVVRGAHGAVAVPIPCSTPPRPFLCVPSHPHLHVTSPDCLLMEHEAPPTAATAAVRHGPRRGHPRRIESPTGRFRLRLLLLPLLWLALAGSHAGLPAAEATSIRRAWSALRDHLGWGRSWHRAAKPSAATTSDDRAAAPDADADADKKNARRTMRWRHREPPARALTPTPAPAAVLMPASAPAAAPMPRAQTAPAPPRAPARSTAQGDEAPADSPAVSVATLVPWLEVADALKALHVAGTIAHRDYVAGVSAVLAGRTQAIEARLGRAVAVPASPRLPDGLSARATRGVAGPPGPAPQGLADPMVQRALFADTHVAIEPPAGGADMAMPPEMLLVGYLAYQAMFVPPASRPDPPWPLPVERLVALCQDAAAPAVAPPAVSRTASTAASTAAARTSTHERDAGGGATNHPLLIAQIELLARHYEALLAPLRAALHRDTFLRGDVDERREFFKRWYWLMGDRLAPLFVGVKESERQRYSIDFFDQYVRALGGPAPGQAKAVPLPLLPAVVAATDRVLKTLAEHDPASFKELEQCLRPLERASVRDGITQLLQTVGGLPATIVVPEDQRRACGVQLRNGFLIQWLLVNKRLELQQPLDAVAAERLPSVASLQMVWPGAPLPPAQPLAGLRRHGPLADRVLGAAETLADAPAKVGAKAAAQWRALRGSPPPAPSLEAFAAQCRRAIPALATQLRPAPAAAAPAAPAEALWRRVSRHGVARRRTFAGDPGRPPEGPAPAPAPARWSTSAVEDALHRGAWAAASRVGPVR